MAVGIIELAVRQPTPMTQPSCQRAMTALLAHDVFRKLENTPMLVAAAISGHRLGGGFELT